MKQTKKQYIKERILESQKSFDGVIHISEREIDDLWTTTSYVRKIAREQGYKTKYNHDLYNPFIAIW